jgi:hypothetical protein
MIFMKSIIIKISAIQINIQTTNIDALFKLIK